MESFVASPKEAAQRQQLSPEPVAAPSHNRGWQKVRKTLVPPQGGIKAPYVPGPNRCSCGLTPFAVPSLPPSPRSISITGTDSSHSRGHPQHLHHRHRQLPLAGTSPARVAVGAPQHGGSSGEGALSSAAPDNAWRQKPFSHRTRLLSFHCRRFCHAITFILGTGGKRGFKILFMASWVLLPGFFSLPCDE